MVWELVLSIFLGLSFLVLNIFIGFVLGKNSVSEKRSFFVENLKDFKKEILSPLNKQKIKARVFRMSDEDQARKEALQRSQQQSANDELPHPVEV